MIRVKGHLHPGSDLLLHPEALGFVARLHRRFDPLRQECLRARTARRPLRIRDAWSDSLIPQESRAVREAAWRVPPSVPELATRTVEIATPAERTHLLHALNSGADACIVDFEDALSPTWKNLHEGQLALREAVRGTLNEGTLHLQGRTATLRVRPRGWHLDEWNVIVEGSPVSASLFDFGMACFHNARVLHSQGNALLLDLPKLEHFREALLWHQVLSHAEDELRLPPGSFRAIARIETVPAAFQMEEILHALGRHAVGLDAAHDSYLFHLLRTFHSDPSFLFPDRSALAPELPFLRAYAQRLASLCRKRGAQCVGASPHPGFTGLRVTHPEQVSQARSFMDQRAEPDPRALLDLEFPSAEITEAGVRSQIALVLAYLDAWLQGQGTVTIDQRAEDTASAELARALLWQWVHRGVRLGAARVLSPRRYSELREAEILRLGGRGQGRLADAVRLLDRLVLSDTFIPFLTHPAYRVLETRGRKEGPLPRAG